MIEKEFENKKILYHSLSFIIVNMHGVNYFATSFSINYYFIVMYIINVIIFYMSLIHVSGFVHIHSYIKTVLIV